MIISLKNTMFSSSCWAATMLALLFLASIALMIVVTRVDQKNRPNFEWWQRYLYIRILIKRLSPLSTLFRSVIYHVFTPSFYDANGDGIGDLQGKNFMNTQTQPISKAIKRDVIDILSRN